MTLRLHSNNRFLVQCTVYLFNVFVINTQYYTDFRKHGGKVTIPLHVALKGYTENLRLGTSGMMEALMERKVTVRRKKCVEEGIEER